MAHVLRLETISTIIFVEAMECAKMDFAAKGEGAASLVK